MQNIKLQYHGFKPSAFVQRYLNSVLIKSVEDAPSKSFIVGHFSRNKKMIKGFVQVSSHSNQFTAASEGERFKDVTKKISTQLKKKIEKMNEIKKKRNRLPDILNFDNENKVDAENESGFLETNLMESVGGDFHDYENTEQQGA